MCLNCPPQTYFYNFECFSKCPNKTFPNQTLSICQLCQSPCENCLGENKCLSCRNGYFFDTLNSSCQESCPDYYFTSSKNNSCVPCHPSCKTCLDELDTSCIKCNYLNKYIKTNEYCVQLQCKPNEYIIVDTIRESAFCQPCNPACASCDGPGNNNCISCEIGYLASSGIMNNRLLCRRCEEIDSGLYTDTVNIGKCKGI